MVEGLGPDLGEAAFGSTTGDHWLTVAEEAFVPADAGGRVETLNFLTGAAAAGVRLHVIVPGATPDEEDRHRAALPSAEFTFVPRRTTWRAHLSLAPYVFVSRPLPPDLMAVLLARHEGFTAVVSVTFRVAHLGMALARGLRLPHLVRPHNLESDYFGRLARSLPFPRRLPYLAESWKLRRAERQIHRSPHVTAFADLSALDATRRRPLTPTPTAYVPPFVPQRVTAAPPVEACSGADDDTVLFLGSLDNANNVDGVRWFVEQCWPRIRSRRQQARFHVVGRHAPPNLRAELQRVPGVSVTVDAPSVTPHLAAATVFVNPVRRGAGVNIKVVEAMAAGLPVVSTAVGSRGVHWKPGSELIVADQPAAFADAVVELLGDPTYRAALAEGGRQFVRDELDPAVLIERMRACLGTRTTA